MSLLGQGGREGTQGAGRTHSHGRKGEASIPKEGSGNMSKYRSLSLFSKSRVVLTILLLVFATLQQTSLGRMKGWICISFINNHELEFRSMLITSAVGAKMGRLLQFPNLQVLKRQLHELSVLKESY